MDKDELDANGHYWVIGIFQTEDESECRHCRCDSDSPEADKPCAAALRSKVGGE